MKTVIITGGGASGMAAACSASLKGHKVILIEKNEKLGKKVYISGKGRCNLTNASDIPTIMNNVVTNPKFLYSALYGYTNDDVIAFMEENGCPVKTERGNRVFPVSDHASDVIRVFERFMKEHGVDVRLNTKVKRILTEDGHVTGVETSKGVVKGDAVIVCTGGVSYQLTGSTGDGIRFAEELGHRTTELLPALVPFKTEERWVSELSGLSLKNISIRMEGKKGTYYEDFGEMLFTHFGVSGPVILSASSLVAKRLRNEGQLKLYIDLKPALTEEMLDERLLRDFEKYRNRQFGNALDELLPKKLIPVVISYTGIPEHKKVNEISREERRKLTEVVKNLPLTVFGTQGMNEAIVTQGGVSVKDIDASTMESKLVKGLYFAGEVIDIDALTGGYNLQLAWSTGHLAGESIE